jgi:hypothetical protein
MNLVVQTSAAIAGGASATPFQNNPIERPDFNAYVSVGVNGSAAGLTCALWIGGRAEFDTYQVNALNRFPLIPDDIFVRDSMCPALRLNRLLITNPTAGALTHFTFARAGVVPYGLR